MALTIELCSVYEHMVHGLVSIKTGL